MKALGNNLLIKPCDKNKVLKSGIIIPDSASPSGLEWGTVVETCTDDIEVVLFRKLGQPFWEPDTVPSVNPGDGIEQMVYSQLF